MRRAKQNPEGRYAALDAMRAAAISILLSCPMRVANLAALDLKRHVRQRRGGRYPLYSIRIEGCEVKNGTPIEADFGVEVSRILQTYIQQFRPMLTEAPSTALFPQRSTGAPRRPGTLSQDLSAAILRETGLMVHAHLFRHLAAKLFLDASPGEYETVRRILGHKKLETTVQFYSRLTSKKAVERYEDVVLAPMRGKGDG
ncbi:MAG: hypothetical protein D6757_10700 [Alphaproteobacteria bacterium]|nr:MAG: hypothetical protein D6757_10700 [Alphaproteobacteria bacterium]